MVYLNLAIPNAINVYHRLKHAGVIKPKANKFTINIEEKELVDKICGMT